MSDYVTKTVLNDMRYTFQRLDYLEEGQAFACSDRDGIYHSTGNFYPGSQWVTGVNGPIITSIEKSKVLDPKPVFVQSTVLWEFYRSYVQWLDAGTPENNHFGFRCNVGLCMSLKLYLITGKQVHWSKSVDYSIEMRNQFLDRGLDPTFPFHANADDFYMEPQKHLNPDRQRWARARAAC